jgi:hypothetical protein
MPLATTTNLNERIEWIGTADIYFQFNESRRVLYSGDFRILSVHAEYECSNK